MVFSLILSGNEIVQPGFMYRTYSKFIYHGSKLHYSVFGEGEKVLLMFHGFGHTHKQMREIEEALSPEFKIYNFDLFFHGFSEWNHNDTALTHDFWQRMLDAFFAENAIEKFSLLGFSLGAKVALASVELFPEKVEQLFLIAPDGIKNSPFYNMATLPAIKGLFRQIILQPAIFYKLVKILSLFRLVDKSVLRFASIQMNSRDKRRRVYYTWTVYKGLKPNIENIISILNKKEIHTEIFAGKYDRIIRSEQVKLFADRLKNAKLSYMNSGHNNLIDEVAYHLEAEGAKK